MGRQKGFTPTASTLAALRKGRDAIKRKYRGNFTPSSTGLEVLGRARTSGFDNALFKRGRKSEVGMPK